MIIIIQIKNKKEQHDDFLDVIIQIKAPRGIDVMIIGNKFAVA